MPLPLADRIALVTGASRGIGRAIANAFAKEGARVAVCARTTGDIEAVGAELARTAQAVIARAVDVTDSKGVKTFVNEVADSWGGVDVLINNAGQGRGGNLDTLTPEQILEHANVLQMGHFRFIQAVVPHMRKQRWGRPEALESDRVYNKLARENGMTPAQMALAFCYTKWQVTSTIIGVTSLAQLDADLDAWGTTLSPEVLAAIDAIRWDMRDLAQ